MIVIYIYSYSVIITIDTYSNLVGGYNHLEKYESQWEGLSHTSWKITKMFETIVKLVGGLEHEGYLTNNHGDLI